MKKILKNPLGLVLIFSLTFFISCNKNKTTTTPADPEPITTDMANGLPDNPKKINGYAFAQTLVNLNSGNTNGFVYLFAMFGDPTRNLIANYDHFSNNQRSVNSTNDRGNVSVGDLSFNGLMLNNFGSVVYQQTSNFASSLNYANWHSDGNLSFKPLNLSVARGFPAIKQPSASATSSYSIGISKDLTITFSDFISNYDSVCVTMNDYSSGSNGYKIRKTVSSVSNSITFSQTELSVLNTTPYGNINFVAYNYSNKTIEDKIYVFELSNRLNMTLVISQ